MGVFWKSRVCVSMLCHVYISKVTKCRCILADPTLPKDPLAAVKSQLTEGLPTQLLLKISLKIFHSAAGCSWVQSRMKVLLLAALVSQVVGRPQQGEYQPGNVWSNTRPAQPTQWSAWSSVGSGVPSSYNSYDPYNSYNPYDSYVPGGNKQPYLRSNSYDAYVPGGNKQPYLRPGDNSVSGFVGGPAIQDIGLDHQGSLPNVETTRGDMGEPQMPNNVDVSITTSNGRCYRI